MDPMHKKHNEGYSNSSVEEERDNERNVNIGMIVNVLNQ